MSATSPKVPGRGTQGTLNTVYVSDVPREEAQARFQAALEEADLWRVLESESIKLDEKAVGRVTAGPVWARMSSPHYHAAAMDGFALEAAHIAGTIPGKPITIRVEAESAAAGAGGAQYVDTGDPLPRWADAVVPIEDVEPVDEAGLAASDPRAPAAIRIRAAVPPWTHVRPIGEDIVASQLVLAGGTILRPFDLGAAAAAGHDRISVVRQPRVAIIPTGSELTPIGTPPGPSGIIEYNSVVLAGLIVGMGATATRLPIVRDDLDLISEAVRHAAEGHDLIVLNAGSSAGAEDFAAMVVSRLGRLLVHGVAVRPGHPVVLGLLRADPQGRYPQRPIIGVPGYPVSAALTAEIFVEPLIAAWLGRQSAKPTVVDATSTRKLTSAAGDEDYIRVAVGRVGSQLLAAPLASGAGIITSLTQADGVVVIPPGTQGIEAGEQVRVRLYRPAAELDKTIFCIGSHDVTLDLLSQFLTRSDRRLVSANVGSQAGLVALQRGQAHVAGCHLLDPSSGEYNIPFIRRYMPGIPVSVLTLTLRDQGLMVRRGNPKHIMGIEDLRRDDILLVNRQRGAGTRVLLDHHLATHGIASASIHGYGQEVFTHLAAAAAVSSGRADCALGIAAAADALDLDFIPLFKERFDLVMTREAAEDALLAPLIELLGAGAFRDAVAHLPGYDVSVMGRVVLQD